MAFDTLQINMKMFIPGPNVWQQTADPQTSSSLLFLYYPQEFLERRVHNLWRSCDLCNGQLGLR